MKKILVAMAAVTIVLASCGKENNGGGDRAAVRFTAGIENQAAGKPGTRAAGDEWTSGDAIGVFMVDHGTGTIAENAANREYTTTGTSAFTAASGSEIYYPMDGSKVDFIAYYPYDSSASALGTIDVVIGDQTTQPSFDLLWASANNTGAGYSKTASVDVALGFEHMLSKIVLNCLADPSVGTTLDAMTVEITGMNTRNTFDLAEGKLGTTPGTEAVITPQTIETAPGFYASLDAIILPGTYDAGDVKVLFTVGTDTFTWNVEASTFTEGNEYIYEVILKRTGVDVKGTIKPWNPVYKDPVTAE